MNRAKKETMQGDAAPPMEQMSMLPDPMEDAVVRNAASSQLRVVHGRFEKRYSVVGEKQFKDPMLFPPPGTKGLDKPRRIVFNSSITDNGETIEHSIEVLGNNVTSAHTSDTLEVIIVINDMWREQGSSADGTFFGTYSEVVRRLGKDDENNANRHRKAAAKELERLRRCILIFSQYYTRTHVKANHEITYFCDYQYVVDRANPSNNYFRATIDPNVLENIRSGHIAPLPTALLALKFDKSKAAFLRVDSVLATHERCELSCETVYKFANIELTDWTKKPINRRKTLEVIRNDIQGKVLSSGWVVEASLLSNVKGDDIKLVFTRGERLYVKDPAAPQKTKWLEVVNSDSFVVQDLINEMTRVVGVRAADDSLYKVYARSYPEELLRRALSEFKGDKPADLRSPGAFFSTILNRIVQEHGYAWVKQ